MPRSACEIPATSSEQAARTEALDIIRFLMSFSVITMSFPIPVSSPGDHVFGEVCALPYSRVVDGRVYPPGPVDHAGGQELGEQVDQPGPADTLGSDLVDRLPARLEGPGIDARSIAPGFARMPKRTSPPSSAGPAAPAQENIHSRFPSTTSKFVPMSISSDILVARAMPQARMSAMISPPMKSLTAGKMKTPASSPRRDPDALGGGGQVPPDHRYIWLFDHVRGVDPHEDMGHDGIPCNHHLVDILPIDPPGVRRL